MFSFNGTDLFYVLHKKKLSSSLFFMLFTPSPRETFWTNVEKYGQLNINSMASNNKFDFHIKIRKLHHVDVVVSLFACCILHFVKCKSCIHLKKMRIGPQFYQNI